MASRRRGRKRGHDDDLEVIVAGQSTDQQGLDTTSGIETDPILQRLSKTPFYKKLSAEQQMEMYVKESREAEAQAERDRAYQLRIRELEIREKELSHGSVSGNATICATAVPSVELPLWSDQTRPETFFSTCEKLLTAANVPKSMWAGFLIQKISEKARGVYAKLAPEEANDYDILKAEILKSYMVSSEIYRKKLFYLDKTGKPVVRRAHRSFTGTTAALV